MRRRLLLTLAALCAALLLAVATLPFWLGAAAGAIGRSRGLTFASYERVGYGRFVLKDVEYRRPGLKVTASRVESATPLVWGWNHLGGDGSELVADRWLVEVTRRDPALPPSSKTESGWTPLHTILRRVADYLEKYAPRTRTGAGVVRFPGGELMLASAKWEKRELAVEALEFRGRRANVVAGFPAGQNQIVLRAKADAASLELESRGAELVGKGTFWEQPVTLSARFEPRGWIPAEALVNAENFSLPGTRLKLGDLYAAVRGGLRVEWRKDHFAADIQAKGEPVPDKKAPPLELALRGRGDAQAFTVETLNATLPGITARLTEPVTVERSGAFRGSAARFALTADLAAQPWVQAKGRVEGEARVVAGLSAATVLEFTLRARDLSAQQLALAAVETDGRLVWPRLEIARARITGGAGETLEARGGWDFRARELLAVHVSGQVRRASLARWLPKQPEFDAVVLEAQAAGPLATFEHRGKLTAVEVKWSGLNPVAVAGEWNGRGTAVEMFNVKASHAATELALGGAVNAQRLELRAVELKREGVAVLQLTEPATLTWKPTLQLSTLRLAGPDGKLDASLAWGDTGRIEVAARNVVSTWFTEIVPTQAPPWRVDLLALTGKWDRGPMEFSITAGAAVELAKERGAAVNLAARGDKDGVRIEALRATESGTTVVNATGRLPFVLQPGGTQFVRIDPQAALVLDATVSPNAVFWQQLAAASGVELKSPEAALRVAGTWERPEGEARVKAARVAFDPERFKRELPTIEALDVQVIGERTGLRLDNFAVNIEGQPVRARGRLPAPDGDWSKLFKDPLAAAKAGADFRLQVPETEVAVFARFLPAFLAPQGRMELDVGYKGGGLDGVVRLRGAATKPLGPLGVLQEVTAEITLAGRKVEMKQVVAKSGGQPIALTGSIELREKALPRFDLALKGENLPFVRQTGLLLRGDLDLKVATQGDTDVARISGVVNLRDSLFLQDVRAFIPRGGGGGGGTKRPPYFEVTTPPLNAWQLAVEVTGSRFLRLRTPVFVGVASARFRLTGTLGEPRALGEVAINEGRVRMPFASFDVKQGSVRLTEGNPYEPSIYVRATGRRYDYDLTMEVAGEGFSPSVTFSSNPALDSEQVLLMVMTGSSPREDISQTGSQRVAGLGYFLGSSLLGSLGSDAADADKLSFSSGEKVSKAGRETYDIEYKLSDRWTATGEYNEFDEYNAGFKWRVLPRETEAEKKKKADAAQKKAEEAAARAKK